MSDMSVDLVSMAMPSGDSAVSTDSAVVETPSTETNVETTETNVDTQDTTEGSETQETNEDGTEKTPEQKAEAAKGTAKTVDATPQAIRNALKALRDSNPDDPAIKSAVKMLHESYERHLAYTKEFPNVAAARETNDFLRELSGVEAGKPVTVQAAREAIGSLQSTVEAAQESDRLLYAGDKSLIDNVVSDLKDHGKLETALPKLGTHILSALKTENPSGYTRVIAPAMVSSLRDAGFASAVNSLYKSAKASGDQATLAGVQNIAKWFNELEETIAGFDAEEEQVEQKAWQKEKAEFQTKQTQQAHEGIASTAEKSNNQLLGSQLKNFLRMPYFKAFSRENLMPLGNQIKSDLYATLKADKAYQDNMKAMFAVKTPDKAKIQEFHKARVESIAADIVRNAVQRMYPGYASGGSAAGRIANAQATKGAATAGTVTLDQIEGTAGKKLPVPTQVAKRPDNLDRSVKNATLHQLSGKGFVKVGPNSWKFVKWSQ